MDTISKETALLIGLGVLMVIIVVVAAVWYMAPAVSPETAKVTKTVGQPGPIQQEQDPMAELQKLLDAGKAKPLWKQYLETYWPAAFGVGVLLGLVLVVMTLLKRRRLPDDDEEGVLAMDGEDVPSPSDDEMPPEKSIAAEATNEDKIRKPWPWAKIVSGFVFVVVVLIALAAVYSFFSITGIKASQEKLRWEMAAKVNRGLFDSLHATVGDLKATTEELTSKMENTRKRLTTTETKLKTVESTADEAHSIASRAATRVTKLEEKVTRETNIISRTLTTHSNLISKGFARQDSINAARDTILAVITNEIGLTPEELEQLRKGLERPIVP